MLATLEAPAYLARVSVDCVKNVRAAQAAITKAFANQKAGRGFSLVEVVSTCPTNWGLPPRKAMEWLRENMLPYYPLGVYKDNSECGIRNAELEGSCSI
jgi:2-oxoglutarate ferredoxin oxidoreductase subunit beta